MEAPVKTKSIRTSSTLIQHTSWTLTRHSQNGLSNRRCIQRELTIPQCLWFQDQPPARSLYFAWEGQLMVSVNRLSSRQPTHKLPTFPCQNGSH